MRRDAKMGASVFWGMCVYFLGVPFGGFWDGGFERDGRNVDYLTFQEKDCKSALLYLHTLFVLLEDPKNV